MPRRRLLRSEIWQNEVIPTKARIIREFDGEPLSPSDCTSYHVNIYDMDGNASAQVFELVGGDPVDILTDGLAEWAEDDTGYNMSLTIPEAAFTRHGGHQVLIEIEIDTVSEGPTNVVHLCTLMKLIHDG